jgi:dihydroorotase
VTLLLRGGRVVDPLAGVDAIRDVLVRDGEIAEVGEGLAVSADETLDCAGMVVLPGLVDVHTHLREPGREDEETVASGTRAAAAGGYTAICAMPNTEPVADEGAAVRFLLDTAETEGAVRVHAIGAITAKQEGRALAEIGDMAGEGAVAFSDDGHGVADAGMMRLAMDYVKRFGLPVVSHCEDATLAGRGVVNEGVVSTRLGLPGWPAAAEEVQVARDIRLAELTGCRLHLAHLSTAGSVALVRAAKARGVAVTCEVTPHHLFLTEDDVTDRYDTNLKMNPPLRTAEDAAALLEGLLDGTVDCIATDHAPHAAHEKALEFELAPFGTTGLETALALVATRLVASGRVGWADVARWMAHGPRAALGFPEVRIAAGSVADLTIVDPSQTWTVEAARFVSKSRNSAFLGARLTGRARDVLVGGCPALRGGKVVV